MKGTKSESTRNTIERNDTVFLRFYSSLPRSKERSDKQRRDTIKNISYLILSKKVIVLGHMITPPDLTSLQGSSGSYKHTVCSFPTLSVVTGSFAGIQGGEGVKSAQDNLVWTW